MGGRQRQGLAGDGAHEPGHERGVEPERDAARQRVLRQERARVEGRQRHGPVGDGGAHNRVRTVAWSPDGTRLASGSDDRSVRVWRLPAARSCGRGRYIRTRL
ncbi:WD40 repeat domain-containing protein [Nannocystis sp.]|uniref:WD40 repeat domain-containing protein n=1 Tax=Nannocystis sp. TaxID=1962667 RepID=UPI00344EBBC0